MQFQIVAAVYDAARQYLHYTVSGEKGARRFTISSKVKCLKDPETPERLHLVVLLAITDHFNRPSPSGHPW